MSTFINIPDYNWQQPVTNISDLPTYGNQLGDARVVTATSAIYIWNGSAWVLATGGGGGGGATWGSITGTLSNQTDLQTALNAKANLSGAVFSGSISATNLSGTNTGDVTLGTANGLSLSDQILSLSLASASSTGALSSTDWNTFNNNSSSIANATPFDVSNTIVKRDSLGSFSATVVNSSRSVIFSSATNALVINTTSFVFDSVNNALGINTIPSSGTIIDFVSSASTTKAAQLTGYGSNVGIRMRRAGGTIGSPSASQPGDILGFYSARGYGSTSFATVSTGAINIIADGAGSFTDASMPTYLGFNTTPVNSTTSSERMRLSQTGNLLISTTVDNAIDNLQVNGSIYSNSLKLFGSVSGQVVHKAPSSVVSYTLTWPSTQSSISQVSYLSDDGTGTLSWTSALFQNIDAGNATSVYPTTLVINGGTA